MDTLSIARVNSPDKRRVKYEETVGDWDVYIVIGNGNGFSKMAVNKSNGEIKRGGIALEYDLGKPVISNDTDYASTANTDFSKFKPLT